MILLENLQDSELFDLLTRHMKKRGDDYYDQDEVEERITEIEQEITRRDEK